MKRGILLIAVAALLVLPMAGMADSVTPTSYSDTLAVGESVTITKTVTIEKGLPTDAVVDILFLFDTTSSMGGNITDAKNSATSILSSTGALGDVQWGVARYDDFQASHPAYLGVFGGSGPTYNDTPFEVLQDLTASAVAVSTGIGSLSLNWGGDNPESNLYALAEAAKTENVSWRDDAVKIIVWMGDAAGHDADLEPYYASATGSDVGLADAIAALNAENIIVEAIDWGNSIYGLDAGSISYDADGTYGSGGSLTTVNLSGQATSITNATGGSLAANSGDIVTDIMNAIEDVFATYTTVDLVPGAGDYSGVSIAVAPTDYPGTYDRSVERTFEFDVTFTGVTPGTYDFTMDARVDGGIVARELDHIVVGAVGVPEPSSLLLLGMGLLGLAGMRRRFKV